MFATFKQIFTPRNKELRKRILFTLGCLAIFIIGTTISIPNTNKLSGDLGFLELLNSIGGGALKRGSIFGLGVMPYISASIIIQLFTMNIIPYFTELAKEGYSGRRKLNTITRYLGIAIAFIQGIILSLGIVGSGSDAMSYIKVAVILTAGTAFLLWIGDQITQKGVGNGLSLIIMAGIVAQLPYMMTEAFKTFVLDNDNLFIGIVSFIIYVAIYFAIVIGVVFIQESERRIPIQYSNKTSSAYGAKQTYIPFRVNAAGVMPVIFASSFMTFPAMIIQMFNANIASQTGFWATIYKFSIATSTSNVGLGYTIANAIVYLLLILGFTYFYTYATFNPAEVSSNIKKNGGFIPGIRAGKPTTDYLSSIMSKLTLFGGIFLSVIAILPMLMRFTGLNVAFGGTSILIVVGVALETVQQLESRLVMRHYKGFLE